jgi:hypothetical protein
MINPKVGFINGSWNACRARRAVLVNAQGTGIFEYFVDGSRHQCPMLGESERHRRGKLESPEVVTICNHLVALGLVFNSLEFEGIEHR